MTKLDDISEAIGQLRAEVRVMHAQQQDADRGRARIYDKLDGLARKIDSTDSKVSSIDQRLEKVEEPVAEFSRWRERGVGAVMLISFAAASFGGLLATFGRKIWAFMTGS